MTTTTATRGPRPTADDITKARTDLRQWRTDDRTTYGYPSMLGTAWTLLELIAEAHTHCRKPHCVICRHLRRATAIFIAHQETP